MLTAFRYRSIKEEYLSLYEDGTPPAHAVEPQSPPGQNGDSPMPDVEALQHEDAENAFIQKLDEQMRQIAEQ